MSVFANNLKAQVLNRMKEKNLGPIELEKRAGLTRGAATNIIHGRSKNPTLETISSIANVLNCTIDELLEDPEKTVIKTVKKQDHQYETLIDLFYQVLDHTVLCIKNVKQDLSLDQFLDALREGYVYSLLKNNKQVDKKFIEWIIDKNANLY